MSGPFRPGGRSTPPPADIPIRAREKVAAERARANANVTVRVENLSSASAQGRYAIPRSWPKLIVDLRVSPVMADLESPLGGLVLSGQGTAVVQRVPATASIFGSPLSTPMPRVLVWGADDTFTAMSAEDWRFVVQANCNLIVPTRPTSHVRCLAYYDALPKTMDEHGLEVLRRWGQAIDLVRDGIEMLDGLYGRRDDRLVQAGDVDLTVEEILRTRDRDRIHSWTAQARTVANAAKTAHAAAMNEWMTKKATVAPCKECGDPEDHDGMPCSWAKPRLHSWANSQVTIKPAPTVTVNFQP